MRTSLMGVALAGILCCGWISLRAQTQGGPREPFKLGTLERQGQVFLGLVLRDAQVIDIAQANSALERRNPAWAKLATPGDIANTVLFLLSDAARMITGEVIRVDAGQYI